MKKMVLFSIAAILLVACGSTRHNQPPQGQPNLTTIGGSQAVAGEILVKYRGGVSMSSVVALSGSQVVQSTGSDDWGTLALIRVPKGQEEHFLKQYQAQTGVEYAEPNFWIPNERQNVRVTRVWGPSAQLSPTDPYLTQIPPGDAFATAGAHNPTGLRVSGVVQASIRVGTSDLPVVAQVSSSGANISLTLALSPDLNLLGQGTLQSNGSYTGPFTLKPTALGSNPCDATCSTGTWTAALTGISQNTSLVDASGRQTRTFNFVGTVTAGPAVGTPLATTLAGPLPLTIVLRGVFTYNNVPWLWGIHRIGAPAVWASGVIGQGVLVGVIDDGADLTHPDLAPNLWRNPNPGSRVCPGLHGYDFANEDPDPTDTNGHGTHTAGTVAAAANNIGVVGVAPGAKLLIVKGLTYFGGTAYMLTRSLKYVADCGAKVSNNSWGGSQKSKAFEDVLKYGTAKGHVYVFATGNSFDAGNPPSDPVRNSTTNAGVIGVGAMSANNLRTAFSSSGPYVTVIAPGNAILSTIPQEQGNPGDPYGFLQGTSMAAPHVTGVVALMFSAKPSLTPLQVRVALEQTANATLTAQLAKPDYSAAIPGQYGYGLVDAKAAVDYVLANY
jgi:hypothetical protein